MPHQPSPREQPPGEPAEELLAMAAHELRRPLTAMLGALQHRQQTLSTLQQQELLAIARRQGEQLGRLLDEVLAAAGLDRGHARTARRSLVDAAAYSPPGAEILLAASRDGVHAVLAVLDQGPGIPLADRHRIFQRYARLYSPTASPGGSRLGLGLYVARRPAHTNRGELQAASLPESGVLGWSCACPWRPPDPGAGSASSMSRGSPRLLRGARERFP